MLASKRRGYLGLWLACVGIIVAIVVAGRLVSGPQPHIGSNIGVRLAAAAIVTVLAAIAHVVAGRRAAAATAVLGVLIAVLVLVQPA